MDNRLPDRRPSAQFAPDLRLTAAAAAAGAVLAAGAALGSDPAGRLLLVVGALVLAGYVAGDLLLRPRLAVDATGIRIRSPWARVDLTWAEVEQVRADERSRYGLRSVTLEIDAADRLIVLTRRALGAPPEDVASQVRSFDPRRAG